MLRIPFRSSRMQDLVHLNPGFYIKGSSTLSELGYRVIRNPDLQIYDSYYENTQYQHKELMPENASPEHSKNYQPSLIFPLPAIAADTLASHVCEEDSRLQLQLEESDKQEKINNFLEDITFWEAMEFALPSFFINGSMFIRFYKTPAGKLIIESFNTKYCWPEWDENGELESVEIRYIYNTGELDAKKEPIYNWFQYKLGKEKDYIYDNPRFSSSQSRIPEFKKIKTIKHNLGFLMGEWIKTTFSPGDDDGVSLLKNCIPYLDSINYMDSSEGNSIYYHLFPLLAAYNIDFDDFRNWVAESRHVDSLKNKNILAIPKPHTQSLLQFLESSMSASAYAPAYLERNFKFLQQIVGITMLDPDRVAAHAQSGRALELLFKPMIQFIKKRRKPLKRGFCSFIEKMIVANKNLKCNYDINISILEESKKEWGQIFQDTIEDISLKVNAAIAAKQGGIISPMTAIKYIAPNFKVTNPTDELNMIEEAREQEIEQEALAFPPTNPTIPKTEPKK